MLLRGQNLLGYKHYADDVVDEFVNRAIGNGIDIIRIFDALNDTRNLESSVRAVKKYGGHGRDWDAVYVFREYCGGSNESLR